MAMLSKAREYLKDSTINYIHGFLSDIKNKQFDIIFCAQVIQNLTLDHSESIHLRQKFFNDIYNKLNKNGQVIITTRHVNEGSTYSDMYWYADPGVAPKACNHMQSILPTDIIKELSDIGFKNIEYRVSDELIYDTNHYNINKVSDPAWRAADSFWTHVSRYNELDKVIQNLTELKNNNKLKDYIVNRDKLRNNKGHIIVVSGYKR